MSGLRGPARREAEAEFRAARSADGPWLVSRAPGAAPSTARVLTFAAVVSLALCASVQALAQGAGPLAIPRAIVAGRDLGVPFHTLQGVAVDANRGEVAVADGGRHEVVTFDTTGIMLGWFVHQVPGSDGQKSNGTPTWLAVDHSGRLLITDMLVPWVDVVDFRGRSLGRLDVPGGLANGAGALAVGPDGTIYVASRGDSGRVHRFSPRYEYLGAWGIAGTDTGQIAGITGIAVAADGRVYVSCALTRLAVQVFDARGGYRMGFGMHDLGPGNFSLPAGVAVTADGRAWVADEIRQVVQVFDPAGTYVGMFGGLGRGPGEFNYPRALATDGRDLLVVAERVGNRFQVWKTR